MEGAAGVSRSPDGDAVTARFLEWARTNGIEVSPKIAIEKDPYNGRRVVCKSAIDSSELLVAVPVDIAMSADSVVAATPPPAMPHLARWWERHPNSSVRLAAALVCEQRRLAPYIELLPTISHADVPWCWPDGDLGFLPAGMAAGARTRRLVLEQAYREFKESGHEHVPEADFFRAHFAACSRSFAGRPTASSLNPGALLAGAAALTAAVAVLAGVGWPAGVAVGSFTAMALNQVATPASGGNLTMLPMIDMFNHASGEGLRLDFDEQRRCWELRASRRFVAGEEVVISYGSKDSDRLLEQYGFVEEDNPFDELFLPVPSGLSAGTSEALARCCVTGLRLARGGAATAVTEGAGIGAPLPAAALSEAVVAALAAVAESGEFGEEGDARVRAEVASPSRAELIVRWRRTRRLLLAEAGRHWGRAPLR